MAKQTVREQCQIVLRDALPFMDDTDFHLAKRDAMQRLYGFVDYELSNRVTSLVIAHCDYFTTKIEDIDGNDLGDIIQHIIKDDPIRNNPCRVCHSDWWWRV